MPKNAIVSAILNFFLLGPGYIYNGKRPILGVGLTIGAAISTYVELNLRNEAPSLFPFSFIAFFIMATVCAIDGYNEARTI